MAERAAAGLEGVETRARTDPETARRSADERPDPLARERAFLRGEEGPVLEPPRRDVEPAEADPPAPRRQERLDRAAEGAASPPGLDRARGAGGGDVGVEAGRPGREDRPAQDAAPRPTGSGRPPCRSRGSRAGPGGWSRPSCGRARPRRRGSSGATPPRRGRPDGTKLGELTKTLPASTPIQVADVFRTASIGVDVPDAYAIVTAGDGGPVFAYATVIDNQTQDSVFVAARRIP